MEGEQTVVGRLKMRLTRFEVVGWWVWDEQGWGVALVGRWA